jgi:hypothetical protein
MRDETVRQTQLLCLLSGSLTTLARLATALNAIGGRACRRELMLARLIWASPEIWAGDGNDRDGRRGVGRTSARQRTAAERTPAKTPLWREPVLGLFTGSTGSYSFAAAITPSRGVSNAAGRQAGNITSHTSPPAEASEPKARTPVLRARRREWVPERAAVLPAPVATVPSVAASRCAAVAV